jgi:hypothetical protein
VYERRCATPPPSRNEKRVRLSKEERYRLRILAAQQNMSITAYLTWLFRHVIEVVSEGNPAIPGSKP